LGKKKKKREREREAKQLFCLMFLVTVLREKLGKGNYSMYRCCLLGVSDSLLSLPTHGQRSLNTTVIILQLCNFDKLLYLSALFFPSPLIFILLETFNNVLETFRREVL
jgi:hypothetical protein